MPGTARERLAELIGGAVGPAMPSACRELSLTDLSVTVEGVGPLRFPVSAEQAARLRGLGSRARFGRREETLTDPDVRDTWEIPTDLVHIEWTGALEVVLERIRDDLGLPARCGLTPELHSMLVYEPGQFFVTHQDSEQDDAMVGSLVVTLPSAHTGGELVIEHRGQTVEHRGSTDAVSLVAFYSDCHHRVLPVRTGDRITLTYNLLLREAGGVPADSATADSVTGGATTGGARTAGDSTADSALTAELAACLDEHFATPVTFQSGRGEAGPPVRLVYLLDHEYTARGLSWSRLKGSDAGRAALLRAAADRAGCEVTPALAEIQETWEALDPDDPESWGYYEEYREDEESDEDAEPAEEGPDSGGATDPGDKEYVLHDLLDSAITLSHWIGPGGGRPEEISLTVGAAEVSATTSSADLTPYVSEFEGYMGNEGNTLDRWYRRAALVVWPRGRAFANRAEASSAWALDEIDALARAGNIAAARDAARTLATIWNATPGPRPGGEFLGRAWATAGELDDAETAATLLRSYELSQLVPGHAPALAGLTARHGDAWTADLLRGWSEPRGPAAYVRSPQPPEPPEWLTGLPLLCAALRAEGNAGTAAARHILDFSWNRFAGWVRLMLTEPSLAGRAGRPADLGRPLAGILIAAARTGASAVLADAVELVRTPDDRAVSLLVGALRAAEDFPAGGGHDHGLDELAACCADRLRVALARPERPPGDWAIEPPAGCGCDLCGTLGEFLRDAGRRTRRWPLARSGRAHVCSRIDATGLPVRHRTGRLGRPYALVLTKTEELFERERHARDRHEADLAWLTNERNPIR